jgi:hypothetical protein
MAVFNISVPSRSLAPVPAAESSAIARGLSPIKSNYDDIITEAAKNSNIPKELLYSFILFLSNGQNNAPWQSADGQVRSGLFSLSNLVGKHVLASELYRNRMSEAEKNYLRSAKDENLNTFIADKDKVTVTDRSNVNKHWSANYYPTTGELSDRTIPINWQNPKIAIQTGAIWIGQSWDYVSQFTSKPLDKVILMTFLPWGLNVQDGKWSIKSAYDIKRSGELPTVGSPFVKRMMNTDLTNPKETTGIKWLPNITKSGDTTKGFSQKNTTNIINPKGGDIRTVLSNIMGANGSLDLLVNKQLFNL